MATNQLIERIQAMLAELPPASEHPANRGMNFYFDKNGISEAVLRNYLSRAQNCNVLNEPDYIEAGMRMVLYTGAKMISRAQTPWVMNGAEYDRDEEIRRVIELIHAYDPDIIFENCIFEAMWPSVGEIPIPAETFRAFGLRPEERNFSYEAMQFPDGHFLGHWGGVSCVPDFTRIETQMWFYHRACRFIDLGYECIHFGQMMLVCKSDVDFSAFARVIRMIRDYARDHARRGWVLVNAHLYDDRIDGDRLICDFHMSPTRGLPPVGSVKHLPSEAPQEIELCVGHFDAIYLDSVGGITPSGWKTSSLPYLIELDNAGTCQREWLDTPCWPKQTDWYEGGWWGFDEISWFATQPKEYRHAWLRYAWDWIQNIDGFGYCQMPGNRGAARRIGSNGEDYEPAPYRAFEMDDVEAIRQIWVNDRKTRE